MSGMPPVDATLLVAWPAVVAVGCTSSADETATPVEATEVPSFVEETAALEDAVGWTSLEDSTAAPVEAVEGLVEAVG